MIVPYSHHKGTTSIENGTHMEHYAVRCRTMQIADTVRIYAIAYISGKVNNEL